jgi:hypothetical protein
MLCCVVFASWSLVKPLISSELQIKDVHANSVWLTPAFMASAWRTMERDTSQQ